jgi:hypothetical protein
MERASVSRSFADLCSGGADAWPFGEQTISRANGPEGGRGRRGAAVSERVQFPFGIGTSCGRIQQWPDPSPQP